MAKVNLLHKWRIQWENEQIINQTNQLNRITACK